MLARQMLASQLVASRAVVVALFSAKYATLVLHSRLD